MNLRRTVLLGSVILLAKGLANAQGTCSSPYAPVEATVTLQNNVLTFLSPPREPRVGGQSIVDAKSLENEIRSQCSSPAAKVFVARWIGFNNGDVLGHACYPAGGGIFGLTPFSSLNTFCWLTTDDLNWRRREGLEVLITGLTGSSCTFTWQGCDSFAGLSQSANQYDVPTGWSLVAPPYSPYAPATANDLMNDLGFAQTLNVQRYIQQSNGYEVYTGRKGSPNVNYPLTSGTSYIVRMIEGAPASCDGLPSRIEGRLFYDASQNGQYDMGERLLPKRFVHADYAEGQFFGITDANGHYRVCTPPGDVTLTPILVGEESAVPSVRNVSVPDGVLVTGHDFALSPIHDLSIRAYRERFNGFVSPCPEVDMKMCVRYDNTGDFPEPAAQARLQLPPASQATYVSSSTSSCSKPPNTFPVGPNASGLITWDLSGIAPGEGCTVCVQLTDHAPLFDFLSWTASIYLDGGTQLQDFDVPNNQSDLLLAVACSHDPNDIQVEPRGCGAQKSIKSSETLDYVIHFQNLGNAPATNVVVRNVLDRHLDEGTFELIDTSHTLTNLEFDGHRVLTFTFSGIGLPAASSDDAGSRGSITYRVKPRSLLETGTTISSLASIVFDLNAPVVTNSVTSTISGDSDGDTILDLCDNCISTPNANQADTNGDGIGDACTRDRYRDHNRWPILRRPWTYPSLVPYERCTTDSCGPASP